ncbi:MAG: homoserine dehydrogenase [Pseudotabrizicola sp.]|uniref:homoserine dehydrogenase n=1 Tax=Pseudotabrizicola sp. TaxID=2939647 RepID=UPI0027232708|nr:homoserine dehydrogenase [Pseudotabrizicola sp.]MDO8885208.1 homoserine dehydrogenase [Pseudotabrizicola sp.]MDP2082886.1 homoserine dehydrogenase [Pseudotabrizicola sp.]MDZ7574418.1 homoserine dehydrogenase [Pseudotabrizicola sp.]
MPAPLRIGLAGLGTVGIGVVKIVQRHADLIAARAGRPVVITAVSARDPQKNRDADLSDYPWETDPVALAQRDDVDVFVEVMGGHEGPARLATEAAIAAGKDVVTANKALLAHYGHELAVAAEAQGRVIRFEAAVAGGIPVIKTLTEGLAGNQMRRVMGVMNGTCNYILTRMQAAGLPYETVFEEARQLGYLEADPNLDVGGIDAGHKLSLLAAIAFGTRVSFDKVELEGIGNVSIEDINLADDMGYHIKLLGVAQMTGRGLEQRMTPCLVPADSPLGQLQGGTNMVVLEGDSVGQIVMRGAGAGEGPTASAVMADVIDIARGTRLSTFGRPAASLMEPVAARSATPAPYYLRMTLLDKPGALAKIATALGEAGISIDQMRQLNQPNEADNKATVLIVTHKASPADVAYALAQFDTTGVLIGAPVAIRIEEV